jgi:ABC-type lipoprotein release transport system permease subunit
LVHGQGFQLQGGNDIVIRGGGRVFAELGTLPEVKAAAQRVRLSGLVSAASASVGVQLVGVQPERERGFRDLARYVKQGTFLEGEHQAPIVLGSKVVKDLELELGDRVVFTAAGVDGQLQRALFHLGGVLHTGSAELDREGAFTTLSAVQQAFHLGDAVHQIGMMPRDGVAPSALLAAVQQRLAGQPLESLTWDEAMPDVVGMIEMDKQQGAMLGVVLFLVVLVSIVNTFMMVVMERVREFGLLSAIGLGQGKMASLLLYETGLLALTSTAIGGALGFGVHAYVSANGIDLAAMGETIEIGGIALADSVIYSSIDPASWLGATASVFVMVLLSAGYPAYKASRLAPAQAMRFYE